MQVFSQPNSLLHVSFVPNLEARAIQIPKTSPALSFVIANTRIVANKVETGKFNYNLRVCSPPPCDALTGTIGCRDPYWRAATRQISQAARRDLPDEPDDLQIRARQLL